MNVLVYGGGAVGLGISSCLIESGASVSIVAREKTAKVLSSSGFQRTGIFGNRRHAPEAFSAAPCLDPYLESSFDYVIICTKSFDTEAAAADLARLPVGAGECAGTGATSTPRFVLFQNGWGNREVFCRYLPSVLCTMPG